MKDANLPPLHPEFTPLWDDYRGRLRTEKGAFLMTMFALEAGLEVVFGRNQVVLGANFDHYPTDDVAKAHILALRYPGRGTKPLVLDTTVPIGSLSRAKIKKARHKLHAKMALDAAGVLTPFGGMAKAGKLGVLKAFHDAGLQRVLLKPVEGSLSRGILTDVSLAAAAKHIAENPRTTFLVEQRIEGAEFRVYVAGRKAFAAFERIPAHVIGDGKTSIGDLIAAENGWRMGHPELSARLIDMERAAYALSLGGSTFERVPKEGEHVALTANNTTTSGTVYRKLDPVPDEMAKAAVKATAALGLKVNGVDVRLDPKGRPFILEVNARPGIAAACIRRGEVTWDASVPGGFILPFFPKAERGARRVKRFEFAAMSEKLFDPAGKGAVRASDFVEMG